ncbi:DUF3352 domain-containing protein [Adhaeribacter rhizoryzae]|uniref:PQQ-like beta-propeller repeat protein n=1 Tax=Adhaeribacter rhizoryzae TaxID=2607907 RepID=A0A5M6D0W8_9BACT|nr:DUF3352 domain-containing protein [Adhaeribacter rhizoryzae]KAA5539249.1 PQQ-like beta-propeller repeat protein [Adhaeribacter rhizoryzae]
MPKKLLFYSFGLLVLVIAGMYGFTKWTESREKVNLWTLVPEDAVFVIESSGHDSLLQRIQESDLWNNIASVRAIEAISENIAQLDSLSGGRKEGASRFLKRKSLLTSLHVVSKTNFDFVFYIPVNTVGEHRFIRSLVDNIAKSPDFEETSEEYQQMQILHTKNVINGDSFSFFTYHNNLIISANPELIKEIIRKVNRKQLTSPAAEYESINYLSQPDVFAHVFVNYRHLPQFLNIFLADALEPEITYLASLCRSSMLGFKHQRGKIFLNGFSNPEPLAESFYSRIKEQQPKPFLLRNFLPTRTALLLTFGLDRLTNFKHILAEDKNTNWPARQVILADSLTRTFRNELAVAYLTTDGKAGEAEKVIFVQGDNPAKTNGILNAIIKESIAGAAPGSEWEVAGNYTIKQIPVPQFPLLLFGSVAQGFEACYVVQVDNYLVFGKSVNALRQVLTDIQQQNVWANNERMKAFLENTQQETNFSVYLDADLIWRILRNNVREKQQSSLLRHETLIKYFSQLALQYSRQEDQYYTSLVVTHPVATDTVSREIQTFKPQYKSSFGSELISAPFLMNRSVGGASRILVQDSSLTLHALRDNGQIAWSDSLVDKILEPVYPVTFGSDKRVKYLFSSRNIIHCLDQNGRDIQNFPFNLPDSVQVQRLTLLPENNGLFLVQDQYGQLFMFDMVGNLQPGWGPKQVGSPLAAAPQYYNVNGREVILTLHQNGYVYAFNLNGQPYPGFPLAVEGNFSAGVFAKIGKTFRASQVTAVTTNGNILTFNLAGQVQQRQKLPASNQPAEYQLVAEPQGKSYIVVRQEPGQISLYSQTRKLLLQKNFITSSPKLIQYFDFGTLNRIYAITETGPAKLYLYNYRARLIGGQPLPNKLPVALEYREATQTYTLYSAQGKELHKFWFRDK